MPSGYLALSSEESQFLSEELRFQLSGATKSEIDEIERLLPGVERRDVPTECVPILERLLETELASGTLRGRRGDEGERLAIHIYERTPRGAGLIEHMRAVNSELARLSGNRILDSRCVVPKFGELSVLITTETAEVMLTFTGAGLEVNRIELGAPLAAPGGNTAGLSPPPSSRSSAKTRAGPASRARAPAKGSKRAPPRRSARRSSRR